MRISKDFTIFEAIITVSEGNPGALTVCSKMVDIKECKIDADAFFLGARCLQILDKYDIYGSNIWILYKDCCNEDIGGLKVIIQCMEAKILLPYTVAKLLSTGMRVDIELYTASLIRHKKEVEEYLERCR